eukprot:TRINITY_DN33666_c0_g1_i2.p1 TRINITY_DN33666_c0_g1~~TRINITY_DN33666_c0_g1_i2.p1  ORF type:complete len:455 (+),score=107.49 TRINITY_DN33666_c0_g1_i2:71-1366(+)
MGSACVCPTTAGSALSARHAAGSAAQLTAGGYCYQLVGAVRPALPGAPRGLRHCHATDHTAVVVTAAGEVLSWSQDWQFQDYAPFRLELPWAAEAVCCGDGFAVALQAGGGAVYSWAEWVQPALGRRGGLAPPAPVFGLPGGDPVVHIACGPASVLAVTASGDVYGWGENAHDELALGACRAVGVARRSPELSSIGFRRVACCEAYGIGETKEGGMRAWGSGSLPIFPDSDSAASGVRLPLRSLSATSFIASMADVDGQLFLAHREGCCGRSANPEPVAESGALWSCFSAAEDRTVCRSISAAHPSLPLGLVPCGGGRTRVALAALEAVWPGGSGGIMAIHGRDLGLSELALPLQDVGASAECAAELLRLPPADLQPAAEGPLVLFVAAPRLGRSEPVCVEVAADASVGGLAARAALQMGLVRSGEADGGA